MKRFLGFTLALVALSSVAGIPTGGRQLNKVIRDFQKNFTKQKGILNPQAILRNIATMGILMGTVNVEKQMEQNILKKLGELQIQAHANNSKAVTKKMREIESAMQRDTKSIEILRSALNLALKNQKPQDYKKALKKASNSDSTQLIKKIDETTVDDLQKIVRNQLKLTHEKVNATVYKTIRKMESIKTSEKSSTSPTITSPDVATHLNDIISNRDKSNMPQLHVQVPIWPVYQLDVESFYRFRRQNDDEVTEKHESENSESEKQTENSKEEENEFDDAPASNGGGITGLIASLSGGSEGSDVGALLGAVSGVVTNLFGPGGLDIPSLISTGTSLISGLLSGDDNFGTVLANYIGIAVEGLSGGGGADNNGAFFGNFVGTLLGSLSADPEEEAGPMPKLFFDSFFNGFEQTKQKRGTEEPSSEHHKKSYFFEFISNILSSIVGGVTNLILNSSLGSSGGSSQASADLSAGSSQGSHTGSAYASQTSATGSSHPMLSKPR